MIFFNLSTPKTAKASDDALTRDCRALLCAILVFSLLPPVFSLER